MPAISGKELFGCCYHYCKVQCCECARSGSCWWFWSCKWAVSFVSTTRMQMIEVVSESAICLVWEAFLSTVHYCTSASSNTWYYHNQSCVRGGGYFLCRWNMRCLSSFSILSRTDSSRPPLFRTPGVEWHESEVWPSTSVEHPVRSCYVVNSKYL